MYGICKKMLPVLVAGLMGLLPTGQAAADEGVGADTYVDPLYPRLDRLASKIWNLSELGYLEEKSSALMAAELKKEGFQIEKGVAGLPTAFVATYGSGGPVIGFLGEMDALPGISQASKPFAEKVKGKPSSQACGHNLFAAGSVGAAIAIKNWLKDHKIPGTVKFFATPAEEGGSGKVYMVRAGLFDDVDIILHWHPASLNAAVPVNNTAVISTKFRFHGIASHAASSPERGRSALDGVEAMDYMINMMREHMRTSARIHYVITNGGSAPNVVPDFAEVYYYFRESDAKELHALWERGVAAAQGAAQGTGTTVDYEIIHGTYNLLPNISLQKLLDKNLRQEANEIKWTAAEQDYARKIYDSLKNPWREFDTERDVVPFEEMSLPGSSDVGDVSWTVPTAGFVTTTWVPGTDAHTWQASAVGKMGIGFKGMHLATKVLTLTAVDLYQNPDLVAEAKREFLKRRGSDFTYKPLVGDRQPPLDYRKDGADLHE